MSLRALSLIAAVAASTVIAAFALSAGNGSAVASSVSLTGPAGSVAPGDTITLDVLASDLPPIGAYEVIVGFDPLLVEFISGNDAGFLSSTGRQSVCLDAVLTTSSVRFGCGTTGSGGGAEGDGMLAQLHFRALDPGRANFDLRTAGLAGTYGDALPDPALGGAAVEIARRGPEATPTPAAPTATETPTPAPRAEPTTDLTPAFVPPSDTMTPAPRSTSTAVPTATVTARPAATRTPVTAFATQPPTAASPAVARSGAEPTPFSGVLSGDRRPAVRLPDTGAGPRSTRPVALAAVVAVAAVAAALTAFVTFRPRSKNRV